MYTAALLKQKQFRFLSTLYSNALPLLRNRGMISKKNGKWNVLYVSLSFILPFSLPAYESQKRRSLYHKNIPMDTNVTYKFV